MPEKYELGHWEIACIVLNVLTYKVFTGFPRLFAEVSGTGGWLTAVAGGIIALLLLALIFLLYRKLGKSDILEVAELAAGKFGRYLVGTILLVYLVFSNALALREFTEVMKTVAFPSAALAFVMLFFVAAMVVGVLSGFDAIARLHVLAVPVAIVITVTIVLSAIRYGTVGNLFPILGTGADKVFGKGLITLSIYSDVIVLFLINPFAKKRLHWRRIGFFSALGGVVITAAVILTFIMIVPYPTSADTNIPIYPLAKVVYYGRFFQRLDAFYMLALAIVGMLYLSVNLFFTTRIFSDMFTLPRSRPLAWAFGLLNFLLALTVQRSDGLHRVVYLSSFVLWGVGFLIPLMCAFLARLRKKEGDLDE